MKVSSTLEIPENSGVIIQARTGSTRLPGKMSAIFYEGLTLAEVIFKKLQPLTKKLPVILATSENKSNDCLEIWAKNYGLQVFRGDENDVLSRFTGAAEKFNIRNVVRVCADNPFLSVPHIYALLDHFAKDPQDYLSYRMNDGTPVIKSHLGLFTEVTTLEALKKIKQYTTEPLYLEHVTNYLYAHPDKFKVKLISAPAEIAERGDIRLTIDTDIDFKNAASIFAALNKNEEMDIAISKIVAYLDNHPENLLEMQREITKNAK